MPLGKFPPNVAVGLLASVRVLHARSLYYNIEAKTSGEGLELSLPNHHRQKLHGKVEKVIYYSGVCSEKCGVFTFPSPCVARSRTPFPSRYTPDQSFCVGKIYCDTPYSVYVLTAHVNTRQNPEMDIYYTSDALNFIQKISRTAQEICGNMSARALQFWCVLASV